MTTSRVMLREALMSVDAATLMPGKKPRRRSSASDASSYAGRAALLGSTRFRVGSARGAQDRRISPTMSLLLPHG